MDQVKVALAVLKKHHFWVLVVLVLLVGGAVWAMASSELAKQYETRKTDIEGKLKSVRDIPSNPPNQTLVDAIKQRHGMLKEEVLEAWEFLYKEQKKNNPWPAELGEDFLMVINSLGPEDDIPAQYRETYQNFIANHLKMLDDIIDRRKPKYDPTIPGAARPGMMDPMMSGGGMMGEMSGAGTDKELVGKTFWDDVDRVKQGFMWSRRPETIQVRTAQEDLWVYEALLRIIRNTNAGASHHYNASVKSIAALQIGRAAAAAFQQSASRLKISGPQGGGMSMEGMEGMSGDPGMMSMDAGMMGAEMEGGGMMSGDPMGGGGGDVAAEDRLRTTLYNGRYVDEKGKPLMASSESPFAEFKMMPIRMALVIDQRKIPKLLVECANSSMPVEVHRVTLNPGKHATINFSGFGGSGGDMGGGYGMGMSGMGMGMDGMGGGMADMGGGMSMGGGDPMGGGYGGDPMGGMGTGFTNRNYGRFDLPIEVEIIYIFNPPDREKLGTGTAGDESAGTADAGSPVPAAPASGPVPKITATPPVETPAAAPATPEATSPAAPAPAGAAPAAARPGQPAAADMPGAEPPATPPASPQPAPAATPAPAAGGTAPANG